MEEVILPTVMFGGNPVHNNQITLIIYKQKIIFLGVLSFVKFYTKENLCPPPLILFCELNV